MSRYLIHKIDQEYSRLYEKALHATQMEHSEERYARFYNLLQFFKQTLHLSYLPTAEAGCWRGLSSHMLLQVSEGYLGNEVPDHYILDSFCGLSQPTDQDHGFYNIDEMKGRFSCDLSVVQNNLSPFADYIEFVPGWIPDTFTKLPEQEYSFVHVDLELFEPTYSALKYFYPRLASGGILVCDDCGYLSFPGSNRAMSKFCEEEKIRPIYLTTGNGVLIKR